MQVAQRQVAALNHRDLDALMALYAEDAVLEFPASPLIQGRRAIREAFSRFFQDWEEEITLRRVVAAGEVVAAEGIAQGRHRTLHLRIPGRIPGPRRTYRQGSLSSWRWRRARFADTGSTTIPATWCGSSWEEGEWALRRVWASLPSRSSGR
ncbi:MAG: nuclear transport factor 2 family protein [Armatimonadota bacterium]|nr:nuclear transport factor 2 family protein [Armatimonadota bacterium]